MTKWAVLAMVIFAVPAAAQQTEWAKLPRMQLERQFAGPLQDTVIQRWRDPADGMICYIYLPITAQHTPPTQSGYVQYGANVIGSISCTAPTAGAPPAAQAAPAAAPAAPQAPAGRRGAAPTAPTRPPSPPAPGPPAPQ
jgi:hypothetical protein